MESDEDDAQPRSTYLVLAFGLLPLLPPPLLPPLLLSPASALGCRLVGLEPLLRPDGDPNHSQMLVA